MTDNSTNQSKTKSLTAAQRRTIAALLECNGNREAATQAGIKERTLYRWLKLPLFVDELRAAETQIVDSAIRRLAGLTAKAVDALENVIEDPISKPSTKLQAANITLARFGELREEQELERRLAKLEEDLKP